MIKRIFLFLVATIILTVFLPIGARADVVNPDYLTKKCGAGEKEITCSYSSKEPFEPRTTDGCKQYADNPNYYYLTGRGSSFGGEEKYCLKANAQDNAAESFFKNKYVMAGGAVIAVAVISLIILFLIRSKNVKQ